MSLCTRAKLTAKEGEGGKKGLKKGREEGKKLQPQTNRRWEVNKNRRREWNGKGVNDLGRTESERFVKSKRETRRASQAKTAVENP